MDIKEEIKCEIKICGLDPDKCVKVEAARHLVEMRFRGKIGTGLFQASLMNFNMLNGDILK